MTSLETHRAFVRKFSGDNSFEHKALSYLHSLTGTWSLLRMPLKLIAAAVERPLRFRLAVEEWADAKLL